MAVIIASRINPMPACSGKISCTGYGPLTAKEVSYNKNFEVRRQDTGAVFAAPAGRTMYDIENPTVLPDFAAHRWTSVLKAEDGSLWACREDRVEPVGGTTDIIPMDYLVLPRSPQPWQTRDIFCIPTAGHMRILAGDISSGDAVGDDSTVRFNGLGLMATDPTDGSLFVMDIGNGKIKRRDAVSGVWTTFLSDSGLLAPSVSPGFNTLPGSGICFASNGDMYYVRTSGSPLFQPQFIKVPHGSSSGSPISYTSVDFIGGIGFTGCGIALSADQSLLYIPSPNVFAQQKLYALDLSSGVVIPWAGDGDYPNINFGTQANYYSPTRNANRLTCQMPTPICALTDASGRVYILHGTLGGISRVNLDNSVTRITGTAAYVHSTDGPFGNTGCNYFGDGLPASNQYIQTIGSTFAGDFVGAVSFDISDCFDLCIADTNDMVVRTIGSDGKIFTLAGGPRINALGANPQSGITPTTGRGAPVASPILGTGMTVDANAYGLPGKPVSLRARPRSQGGGLFVALASTAHCIVLVE